MGIIMEKWTTTTVVKRFEECVSTLRKLPGAHRLNYINYWPDIIYSERELAHQAPTPIKLWATPEQITRMDETLSWLGWVNQVERRLIWLRAEGARWREMARRTGFPKTSAQRYYQGGLLKIAQQLSALKCMPIHRSTVIVD